MWMLLSVIFVLFAESAMASCPLIIAHRGSSGFRPEHTLAAYDLAISQGADFIEVDVVSTRDGVLVARHENELSDTTDVATRPEFADRKTKKVVDGKGRSGWFSEDFSLQELKRLRAIERMPTLRPESQGFDRQFPIPTLEEVIDLVRQASRTRGTDVGLYIETKHPTYFRSLGLALEDVLTKVLARHHYREGHDPVFLESFEPSSLRTLQRLSRLRLVQLLGGPGDRPYDLVHQGDSRTTNDLLSPAGLSEIAQYAAVVGISKEWFNQSDDSKIEHVSATLIRELHQRGLQVHVWTFRNENYFLPETLRTGNRHDGEFPRQWGNALHEYQRYFQLHVEGVLSDFPATARQALVEYQKKEACP